MQDTVRATMDAIHGVSKGVMDKVESTIATRAHYSPPWADVSIIGIAGSSGSGKSTLSQAIVRKLNLPWVVIMSIVRITSELEADSSTVTKCSQCMVRIRSTRDSPLSNIGTPLQMSMTSTLLR